MMKATPFVSKTSYLAIAAALAFAPIPAAFAQDTGLKTAPGTIELRARFLGVFPSGNISSSNYPGGIKGDLSNTQVPEFDISYFLPYHLAVELIAAVSQHDVSVHPTAGGTLNLGQITLLPPTLLLQYHFQPTTKVDAYLGAGINYTFFFDQSSPSGTAVRYDNTFGEAIQAGFDYDLGNNWVANLDVKHIFLNTNVYVNHAVTASVDIDPTIVGAGIGYRF